MQARAHLEQSAISRALRCIGDALITTDRDGRVSYLNPVAEALTGHKLSEAIGRPLNDIVLAYDETGERRIALPPWDRLSEARTVQSSHYCVLRNRDGEHAIRWSAAPIQDGSG